MIDTSTTATETVRTAILRIDPAQRVRDALAHSEWVRELALSRLKARHPDKTTLELVELLIGETLVPRDAVRHSDDDRSTP